MSADALVEALSCTIETRDDGAVIYRNAEGQLHRTHGPAIIRPDGAERWYQNGLLHRIGGAAITYSSGTKAWYRNGLLHRTDGPAIIHDDGTEAWYQQGLLHRVGGPAVIHSNGEEFCEEDFRMRVATVDYRDP